MKVVVYGAGSVGCLLGGAWAAAGLDIRFIRREAIGEGIAQPRLRASDGDGWRIHFDPDRIDYRNDAAAVADADVIALTVKSTATETAAREIIHHARPGATLISFQNGISNAEVLQRLLPALKVVQGMVP